MGDATERLERSAREFDEPVVDPLLRRVVGRGVFRMPLHADDAVLLVLDCFEQSVGCATDDHEPGGETIDA